MAAGAIPGAEGRPAAQNAQVRPARAFLGLLAAGVVAWQITPQVQAFAVARGAHTLRDRERAESERSHCRLSPRP